VNFPSKFVDASFCMPCPSPREENRRECEGRWYTLSVRTGQDRTVKGEGDRTRDKVKSVSLYGCI
jgi:hypothetical protein